jgi:FkbM family methyltransferase
MDVVLRRKKMSRWLWILCIFSSLNAEIYYEGTATFRGYGKVDLSWLVQFLPYNPVIVEVGGYLGEQTLYAAKVWPQHKNIYVFEPNPRAFNQLYKAVVGAELKRVKLYNLALNDYNGLCTLYLSHGPGGNNSSYEYESSLLPPTQETENRYKGPKIEVPCVVLDDWCQQNDVDHIDILRLELEGLELQALQSSPHILKKVHILIVQSFFFPYRHNTVNYFHLKEFLTNSGFVPLAHWYSAGERGLAVYVSQEMYDAYFVRCLGLGLGGLLYP